MVCPLCKSPLECSPVVLRCIGCGTSFPRTRTDCYELLPPHVASSAEPWSARQQAMEQWYRDMVGTDWAHACFDGDYEPLRPVLERCQGTVLDLGGGAGVTRQYLPAHVDYVSLDPSLMWLGPEWETFTSVSPQRSLFVQGTGEALPFAADSIDAVLALWSLNHVSDPVRVFDEVRRVLKPRGLFFIVLEDMEPRWRDVVSRRGQRGGLIRIGRELMAKVRAALPGGRWSLQPDHIRILESDLERWAGSTLTLRRRAWFGDYLTCEYIKQGRRD